MTVLILLFLLFMFGCRTGHTDATGWGWGPTAAWFFGLGTGIFFVSFTLLGYWVLGVIGDG